MNSPLLSPLDLVACLIERQRELGNPRDSWPGRFQAGAFLETLRALGFTLRHNCLDLHLLGPGVDYRYRFDALCWGDEWISLEGCRSMRAMHEDMSTRDARMMHATPTLSSTIAPWAEWTKPSGLTKTFAPEFHQAVREDVAFLRRILLAQSTPEPTRQADIIRL